MGLIIFLIVYCIIHALVCIIIYFGTRARLFRFSEQLLPIIFMVPIWGVAVGFVANYYSARNKTGSKEVDLDDLRMADDDIRMFHITDEETENVTVPLGEAMSINDSETRRALMMDILHRNPDEFINLLQEARMDSDIEVIHYASTAMMEIQRDYELAVQRAEKAYDEHPEDDDTLQSYVNAMKGYIASGLIEENVLYIHRKRYSDLLEIQMRKNPDDFESFLAAADNYMELNDYTSSNMVIRTMMERWPSDERSWFAQIRICQQLHDGVNLQKTIEDIKRRGIYLTPEGKSMLAYWEAAE